MIEISLSPEPVFQIGKFLVTNSILTSWIVVILLIIMAIIAKQGLKLVPSKFANYFDAILEYIINTFDSTTGSRKLTLEFLPFLGTFFFYILFNNWFGLLPGVGSITIFNGHQTVPLLRGGNADLNSTIALALISVAGIQYYGMKHVGFLKHWGKFFNFKDPISAGVGLLELLGEFTKMISFSFRLFGNMFAGEVLLIVISFLVPIVVPLPFFGLEIFAGIIQAVIFTMLTLVFLNMAVSHETH
jgi:F-type H+-transporting ATPase subunit a